MKFLFPFLCAGLIATGSPLSAQTADDTTTDTPVPKDSTVITSNELHSDQLNHVSVFTGKVIVTGTGFRMTCQEMTVNFTKDNKIDTIVATGDVIITQPDKVTHCGHAEYFRDEDKFVLTDSPSIISGGKDQINSPVITIYRTSKKMETNGGRTVLILGPGSMGSSKDSGTENK